MTSSMTDYECEFLLAEVAMFALAVDAVLWLVFIRSYLRQNGVQPAPELFNGSPLIDYWKARKLSGGPRRMPWFVRVFEVLLITAFGIAVFLLARWSRL